MWVALVNFKIVIGMCWQINVLLLTDGFSRLFHLTSLLICQKNVLALEERKGLMFYSVGAAILTFHFLDVSLWWHFAFRTLSSWTLKNPLKLVPWEIRRDLICFEGFRLWMGRFVVVLQSVHLLLDRDTRVSTDMEGVRWTNHIT